MDRLSMVEVSGNMLVSEVVRLACRIWREHYIAIIGAAQVEYMLAKFQSEEAIFSQIEKEGYLYFLMEDKNSAPAGYIALVPGKNELFISKLYVTKENRGKGYGRQAVEFIEKLACDRGFRKMSLNVSKNNIDSIEAYKKLGFKIIRPVVMDIGGGFVMDDYRMEKCSC